MPKLLLTIETRHDILCPGCTSLLTDRSVTFYRQVAMCPLCAYTSEIVDPDTSVDALMCRVRLSDHTHHRDLHFWTPARPPPCPAHMLTWPDNQDWIRPPPDEHVALDAD